MASTTILVQPDAFLGVARDVANFVPQPDIVATPGGVAITPDNAKRVNTQLLQELRAIPRPVNGIQVKPNTPAYAQVVQRANVNGNTVTTPIATLNNTTNTLTPVELDPGGVSSPLPPLERRKTTSSSWTSWLLQSVREERVEKTQLVETFGDSYLYTYGEKPRSLVFQGILLNTDDYDWRYTFWENWENYFRASRLVELDARMYIRFDDILVEGYPINASVNQTSDNPNMMSFSFIFFVTNYTNLQTVSQYRRTASPYVYTTNLNLQSRDLQEQNIIGNQQDLQRTIGQVGLYDGIQELLPGGSVLSGLGQLALLNGLNLGVDSVMALKGGAQNAINTLLAESAGFATSLLTYLVERNFSGPGLTYQEFNVWFGAALGLIDDIVVAANAGVTQQAADPFNVKDDNLTVVRELLTVGSVGELINKLGYAAHRSVVLGYRGDAEKWNKGFTSNDLAAPLTGAGTGETYQSDVAKPSAEFTFSLESAQKVLDENLSPPPQTGPGTNTSNIDVTGQNDDSTTTDVGGPNGSDASASELVLGDATPQVGNNEAAIGLPAEPTEAGPVILDL